MWVGIGNGFHEGSVNRTVLNHLRDAQRAAIGLGDGER